jgi:hypothetical protein
MQTPAPPDQTPSSSRPAQPARGCVRPDQKCTTDDTKRRSGSYISGPFSVPGGSCPMTLPRTSPDSLPRCRSGRRPDQRVPDVPRRRRAGSGPGRRRWSASLALVSSLARYRPASSPARRDGPVCPCAGSSAQLSRSVRRCYGLWAGWVTVPRSGWVTGRGRAGEGGGCRERTGPAGSGDERVP